METSFCLCLVLILIVPLVAGLQTSDAFEAYIDGDDADAETEEVVPSGLPLTATNPAQPKAIDLLDDNYHMFRRKRAARDLLEKALPAFHYTKRENSNRRSKGRARE